MIYVNGDSHSAGAEIINGYCFANDDPRYLTYGRQPHPDALIKTYGYQIAQTFNQGFFCDAESGSSNARILRTTKKFLKKTKDLSTIGFVIIGWTSWEREEWKDKEDFVQISASGTDSVPEYMAEDYKQWVIQQTPKEHERKKQYWYDCIWNLHCELQEKKVRHLFFHTTNNLDYEKDFGVHYIPISFSQWLTEQNFRHKKNTNHFDSSAHSAWAGLLSKQIMRTFTSQGHGQGSGLTTTERSSILYKITKEYKGLKR